MQNFPSISLKTNCIKKGNTGQKMSFYNYTKKKLKDKKNKYDVDIGIFVFGKPHIASLFIFAN
jgi:hypothetical protein